MTPKKGLYIYFLAHFHRRCARNPTWMEQMSEGKQGALVDYFNDWAPKRFRARNGKPLSKRSHELKIHKFNLPVIWTGHAALIDEQQGDDRLREYALHRRGRR
jgi:hypothetical protein